MNSGSFPRRLIGGVALVAATFCIAGCASSTIEVVGRKAIFRNGQGAQIIEEKWGLSRDNVSVVEYIAENNSPQPMCMEITSDESDYEFRRKKDESPVPSGATKELATWFEGVNVAAVYMAIWSPRGGQCLQEDRRGIVQSTRYKDRSGRDSDNTLLNVAQGMVSAASAATTQSAPPPRTDFNAVAREAEASKSRNTATRPAQQSNTTTAQRSQVASAGTTSKAASPTQPAPRTSSSGSSVASKPAVRPTTSSSGTADKPLKFILVMNIAHKREWTRNNQCYSNVVTTSGPPGWGTPDYYRINNNMSTELNRIVERYRSAFERECGKVSQPQGGFQWYTNNPDDGADGRLSDVMANRQRQNGVAVVNIGS